jgi:Tol biopolymer transport system component
MTCYNARSTSSRSYYLRRFAILALFFATPAPTRSNAADDSGIFVMKIDGSEERKVAEVEGFARHMSPRWSHDGSRLAFEAYEAPDSTRKFFVVNVDGANLQEVGEHGSPDWSPDDQQLIFHHLGGTLRAGVWVQNLASGERNFVVEGGWPRWSRDGTKIAYLGDNTIRYLDLTNNEDRLLVGDKFTRHSTGFDWSHVGTRLAFFAQSAVNGPKELHIASIDGTCKGPRYSRHGLVGSHVSWSPDDSKLAFTIDSYIWIVNVDGDDAPTRLPGQPQKSRDPCWSPDGQWMAFSRRPER